MYCCPDNSEADEQQKHSESQIHATGMSLSGITTPNAQYPTPPQLGAGHAMVLTLKSTFKVFMLFLAYFTCNIFFESFFQSHNLFAMHSADFFTFFGGLKVIWT